MTQTLVDIIGIHIGFEPNNLLKKKNQNKVSKYKKGEWMVKVYKKNKTTKSSQTT
jgi:hypothetical protein